jgi:hypothetical protein
VRAAENSHRGRRTGRDHGARALSLQRERGAWASVRFPRPLTAYPVSHGDRFSAARTVSPPGQWATGVAAAIGPGGPIVTWLGDPNPPSSALNPGAAVYAALGAPAGNRFGAAVEVSPAEHADRPCPCTPKTATAGSSPGAVCRSSSRRSPPAGRSCGSRPARRAADRRARMLLLQARPPKPQVGVVDPATMPAVSRSPSSCAADVHERRSAGWHLAVVLLLTEGRRPHGRDPRACSGRFFDKHPATIVERDEARRIAALAAA